LHHPIIEIVKGVEVVPESRPDALAPVTVIIKARVILEVVHMIDPTTGIIPDLAKDLAVGPADIIRLGVDHPVRVTREVHSAGLILKKKKLSRTLSFEQWLPRSRVKIQSTRMHFVNVSVTTRNMLS
jgi:hypothetical protein